MAQRQHGADHLMLGPETPAPDAVPHHDPVAPFLVLHVNDICNAECAHCVVESGPRRRGRLPRAAACAAIEEAAADPAFRMVVFSGGETFIYLAEILELCSRAHGAGLQTRLISNGYWGRTPMHAAGLLARASEGGCDELAISLDMFHLPYVQPERVKNVWLGARLARALPKLVFTIAISPTPVSLLPAPMPDAREWPQGVIDVLKHYDFELERCLSVDEATEYLKATPRAERQSRRDALLRDRVIVSWQTVVNGGRASRELHDVFARPALSGTVAMPCNVAGHQVTVASNGRLFPCCSSWSNFADRSFGVVDGPGSFTNGLDEMRRSAAVRAIREYGPGRLAERLSQQDSSLPRAYSDICHICQELLQRYDIAQLDAEARFLFDGMETP